jgi:dipeptidyl aminopeptidase/acylaminoacyl peptidase
MHPRSFFMAAFALSLHGENETDVPHQQSADMAAELKKHGGGV